MGVGPATVNKYIFVITNILLLLFEEIFVVEF